MKKINSILFPTDFSEASQNAFRYALWFADKCGADIDLLHVVYPEAEPMDFPVVVARATKDKIATARQMMKVFLETSLVRVQAAHELEKMPDVRPDTSVGIASMVIPEVVKTNAVDMVIMGTQGEHNSVEKTFGSVTTAVMNNVDCPVLVIPTETKLERIDTVAYATDLEEADPYHIWETCKLLSPFHPIMRIVHVRQEGEHRPLNMQDIKAFFDGRKPTLQVTFHDFTGDDVVKELDDFTKAWDVDVMVMYKPHRNFIERMFHKSLTKKETFHTHVPLLVLR